MNGATTDKLLKLFPEIYLTCICLDIGRFWRYPYVYSLGNWFVR